MYYMVHPTKPEPTVIEYWPRFFLNGDAAN
jgi:hypothetical protein